MFLSCAVTTERRQYLNPALQILRDANLNLTLYRQMLANQAELAVPIANGIITLHQASLLTEDNNYLEAISERTQYPDKLAKLIVGLNNTGVAECDFLIIRTISCIKSHGDVFDLLTNLLEILTNSKLMSKENWFYMLSDLYDDGGTKKRHAALICLAEAGIVTQENWMRAVASNKLPADKVATALATLAKAEILIPEYSKLLFPEHELRYDITILAIQLVKLHRAKLLDRMYVQLKDQLYDFSQCIYEEGIVHDNLVRLVDGWIALQNTGIFTNEIGIEFRKHADTLSIPLMTLGIYPLLTKDNYAALRNSLKYKNTVYLGICLRKLHNVEGLTQENLDELLNAGPCLRHVANALEFLEEENIMTQRNAGLLILYPDDADRLHGLWNQVTNASPGQLTATDVETLLECGNHFHIIKERYPTDRSIPNTFGIEDYHNLVNEFQQSAARPR